MQSRFSLPKFSGAAIAALAIIVILAPRGAVAKSVFLSTAQEQALGQKDYETTPKYEDPAALERVHRVGNRLAAKSQKRTGVDYIFTIIDSPDINAFSSYAGYIYVTRGLIEMLADNDEFLAAVIGHEMSHCDNRDVANSYEYMEGLTKQLQIMVKAGMVEGVDPDKFRIKFDSLLSSGLSRTDEFAADAYGALYLYRAGYNPFSMIKMLELLRDKLGEYMKGQSDWSDHPSFTERIKQAKGFIDQMQLSQEKFTRGLKELDKGRYDRAVDDFSQYLSMFYGAREAYNNIGYAYFMKAMSTNAGAQWMWNRNVSPPPANQPAIADMRGATRGGPAPDTTPVELDYGSLYNAQQYFADTLGVDPDYSPAICNYAAVLWTMDKHDEANQQLAALEKTDPDAVCFHNAKGIFLADQKDFKGALEQFSKAVALAPNDVALKFNIAYAYQLAGEKDKASKAWADFIDNSEGVSEQWLEKASDHMDSL